MVIWPADFPTVVHERVEVREVAIQVHSIGVVPPRQVPVAVWALQGKGASRGEYRVRAGRPGVRVTRTGCPNSALCI